MTERTGVSVVLGGCFNDVGKSEEVRERGMDDSLFFHVFILQIPD